MKTELSEVKAKYERDIQQLKSTNAKQEREMDELKRESSEQARQIQNHIDDRKKICDFLMNRRDALQTDFSSDPSINVALPAVGWTSDNENGFSAVQQHKLAQSEASSIYEPSTSTSNFISVASISSTRTIVFEKASRPQVVAHPNEKRRTPIDRKENL